LLIIEVKWTEISYLNITTSHLTAAQPHNKTTLVIMLTIL